MALGSCSPLTQLVQTIFQTDYGVELVVSNSNSLESSHLAVTRVRSNCDTSNDGCLLDMIFNKSFMDSSTKLLVATAAIHESLHAILVRMYEMGYLESPNGQPMEGFKDLFRGYVIYSKYNSSRFLGMAHHNIMSELVGDMATFPATARILLVAV